MLMADDTVEGNDRYAVRARAMEIMAVEQTFLIVGVKLDVH